MSNGLDPDRSLLVWVQIICKVIIMMTKVAASRPRVKEVGGGKRLP